MGSLAAKLYTRLFALGFYPRCRRRTITFERSLPSGGCLFIANHLVTRGPLYVICYMPVPVRIWMNANQADPDRFVENVSRRYLEPVLHIPRSISRLVARIVYIVLWNPFMSGLRTVPVYRDGAAALKTFRASLRLLESGESLVVFPEREHRTDRVSSFHEGVAHLIRQFHRRTGRVPHVIPLAIDQRANMWIGGSVALDETTLLRPEDCTRVLERALAEAFGRLAKS